MEVSQEPNSRKQKLIKEFTEYFINVGYLAVFFCSYAIARRLTLAQFGIYLDDYFIGLIKAMVIGKVIMLASFLGRVLGREKFRDLLFKNHAGV